MPCEFYVEDADLNYVGPLRMLSRRIGEDGSEDDGGYVVFARVQVPKGMSEEQAKRSLQSGMQFGCRCIYDCCAHPFSAWINVRHDKRREYIVETHVRLNI
jgi:hypothetical protein